MALTISQVDQAIEDILLKGQAFSADGATFTRADLDKLRALRREIGGESADNILDRTTYVIPRRPA